MKIGLFGFPQTGKTTLFRLLTGVEPPAHSAPGDAHVAVAKVPDPRLERLAEMYRPCPIKPATVEYLDLAGMEKGQAAKVLPLDQLRTADALAHVVRAFKDDAISHVEGGLDEARDVATMETELILTDHTIAERRLQKVEQLALKTNREEDHREVELIRRCVSVLERETPLRNETFSERDAKILRGYTFLSLKALLIVVNADESDASRLAQGASAFGLEGRVDRPATEVVALSAQIEGEIANLEPADAAAFRSDLGIDEPALDRVIRASYHLLGRISFFTVGHDETRAWTIRAGTAARAAAGAVHSDMERGFIRVEVAAYTDLVEAGSWAACRDRGTLRVEGKDYIVQDGDVLSFRFNV